MTDWLRRRQLTANARSLRRTMTDEERKLWNRLRHSDLGVRFRRQEPVGPFIADFLCHSFMLIVELDGGQHVEQTEYDERRTTWLKGQGFEVLRFWNHEINEDLERVLESIRRFIDDRMELNVRCEKDDAHFGPPPAADAATSPGGRGRCWKGEPNA